MYGQLKSTVKCLECGNISITFDPFLTLSLPISKPSIFQVALVPFEFFRDKESGDTDSDEDYRTESGKVLTEHIVFNIELTPKTTVLDVKKKICDKAGKIGKRPILPENLLLN
jgi:ubiquitin C-terminal hydrolase